MYANDTSITFASGDAEEMNRINLDLNRIEYKYDKDRTVFCQILQQIL